MTCYDINEISCPDPTPNDYIHVFAGKWTIMVCFILDSIAICAICDEHSGNPVIPRNGLQMKIWLESNKCVKSSHYCWVWLSLPGASKLSGNLNSIYCPISMWLVCQTKSPDMQHITDWKSFSNGMASFHYVIIRVPNIKQKSVTFTVLELQLHFVMEF